MPISQAELAGASAADVEAPVDPLVTVRVLKKGHGKISTGRHDPRGGDEKFARDETFTVATSIALELEDLGYAEIGAGALDHDNNGLKGGAVAPTGEGYNAQTVVQLRALAGARVPPVDLSGVTAKGDIIAALELADEAAAVEAAAAAAAGGE